MIDISVTDLVKSFDLEKKILDGVSFQIDTGERVGLLGKNGAGKSTLFNILTGELDYDSGQVLIAPGRRVGLISQIPVYPAGYTVEDVLRSAFQRTTALKEEMDRLTRQMEQGDSDPQTLRRYGELTARFEGLGGYDTDTAVNKVSNGLSIDGDMRQRLFDQLSGGEKTRVNLGRLILEDTDILLLDEPTNHLDLRATEWLEEYLEKFKGTVLTVSHDRYFLDSVVDRIIEIKDGGDVGLAAADQLYATLNERDLLDRVIVGSFRDEVADYITANYPDMHRSASPEEVVQFYFAALTGKKDFTCSYDVLQLPFGDARESYGLNLGTTTIINFAHAHDLAMQYWTVNDEADLAYLASVGADALITDYPDRAAAVLQGMG